MVISISERTLSGCYTIANTQFELSNDIVLFVFQSEGKLFSPLVSDKSSASSATQPSKLSKRETLKVLLFLPHSSFNFALVIDSKWNDIFALKSIRSRVREKSHKIPVMQNKTIWAADIGLIHFHEVDTSVIVLIFECASEIQCKLRCYQCKLKCVPEI